MWGKRMTELLQSIFSFGVWGGPEKDLGCNCGVG